MQETIKGIGQIAVNVHDVDRAVAFYRDVLGLKFLFQFPKMAFFDCGGVRLYLAIPDRPEFDHPASIIYYNVENIQETFATLKQRGVTFITEPHKIGDVGDRELWLCDFKDVDDNVLALMSEIPKSA